MHGVASPERIPMDLTAILSPVSDEMRRVDETIRESLHSDVALVSQLGHYIINSGGKRLRPVVVLMAARAGGYQGEHHVDMAAVIEFIHTATLLHDDVVDGSEMRRGLNTANAIWGNEASVLVGDFLYSRAFQMMVRVGSLEIMNIMADATNTIAAGEVMQLMHVHDPDTTEASYLEVIQRKTATLFEAGARVGAALGGTPDELKDALGRYGLHLGNAFQLVDDLLDYSGSVEAIGKNIGDDLAEGKATLPLIRALGQGDPHQRELIRSAIEHGGLDNLHEVVSAVESTGAIEYTSRLARAEADQAIEAIRGLRESAFRESLIRLADFCVERSY